jgi:hypothetical protein
MYVETKEKTFVLENPKIKGKSLTGWSLYKFFRGTGNSDASSKDTGATSELAVEVSVRGIGEQIVRNLHEVTSRATLLGASSSSTSAKGDNLRRSASGTGRLHLAKTKLPWCTTRGGGETRASQTETGAPSNWETWECLSRNKHQPGPLRGQDLRVVPLQKVRPPRRHRESRRPGT